MVVDGWECLYGYASYKIRAIEMGIDDQRRKLRVFASIVFSCIHTTFPPYPPEIARIKGCNIEGPTDAGPT